MFGLCPNILSLQQFLLLFFLLIQFFLIHFFSLSFHPIDFKSWHTDLWISMFYALTSLRNRDSLIGLNPDFSVTKER